MKKLPIILILSGLAYYIINQLKKSKNLDYKLLGFRIDAKNWYKYGYNKLPILLDLNLFNPTDLVATVTTIKGDVFLNDQFIGTVYKIDDIQIKAKDKTTVSLTALVDIPSLPVNIETLIQILTGKTSGNIYFKGFINSNLGSYTFNKNLKLNNVTGVQ